MRFEQRGELLVQLIELGRDRDLAIRLIGVVGVVFLMVILGGVELGQGLQGGDDGVSEHLGLVQFLDENRSFLLLPLVGVENRRAILRAHVAALAIECGGVVGGKEDRHQVAKGNLRRIEFDFDDLGVAGYPHADLLISGVLRPAAGVAGDNGDNPAQLVEHRLRAPEAAAAEDRDLMFAVAHFALNS